VKKILIVFALMMFSSAHATEWFEVFEKMYLDLDTITFDQRKKQVSFWIKALNLDAKEEINGQKIWFVTTQYTINCKNNKYKNEAFYVYNTKGNEIANITNPTEWEQIVPGTRMAGYEMLMCRLLEVNPKVKKFDKNTSTHRFYNE
jgi:hypothetical protein